MKTTKYLNVIVGLFLFHSVHAQEYIGDPEGLSTIDETLIGQTQLGGLSLQDLIKSSNELDKYFRCHLTTGLSQEATETKYKDYQIYKNSFGKYNQWVAETFGLPKALLECSNFRETKFESDLVSSAGARGLIQMMPATYAGLRKEIQRIYRSVVTEMKFQTLLKTKNVDEITPDMIHQENSLKNEYELDYLKCQQYWYRGGYFFDEMMAKHLSSEAQNQEFEKCADWMRRYQRESQPVKAYHFYLLYALKNSSTEEKKYFSESSRIGELAFRDVVPPENMSEMLDNPILNIALKAYYYKRMLAQMNQAAHGTEIQGQDPVGYLMLLSGGYNAGDGALEQSVEKGASVKEWCQNLKEWGGKEVTRHMLSIRRCLTKDVHTPPTGQNENPRCEAEEDVELSDPCEPTTVLQRSIRPQKRPSAD